MFKSPLLAPKIAIFPNTMLWALGGSQAYAGDTATIEQAYKLGASVSSGGGHSCALTES